MTSDDAPGRLLRVVKVGGSLFTCENLSANLRRWLAVQRPAVNVLLAGGGALADEVRRFDERHALGEQASHHLCIRLLDVTARMLAHIQPTAELTDDFTQLREAVQSVGRADCKAWVFAPGKFLNEIEPHLPGEAIEASWRATSDTIAARLAQTLGADELVLLKPRLPAAADIKGAAAEGYVDRCFPAAAAQLPRVRCIDLPNFAASKTRTHEICWNQ